MPPTPRAISREREPVGIDFHLQVGGFAHAHDGAFAVAFDDIAEGLIQGGLAGISPCSDCGMGSGAGAG